MRILFFFLFLATCFSASAQRTAAINSLFPGKTVKITSPLPQGQTSGDWTATVDGVAHSGTYRLEGKKTVATCSTCATTVVPKSEKPATTKTAPAPCPITDTSAITAPLRAEIARLNAEIARLRVSNDSLVASAGKGALEKGVGVVTGIFKKGDKKAAEPVTTPTYAEARTGGGCTPNSTMTFVPANKKTKTADYYKVDSCFVLPNQDASLTAQVKWLKGHDLVSGGLRAGAASITHAGDAITITCGGQTTSGNWRLVQEAKKLRILVYNPALSAVSIVEFKAFDLTEAMGGNRTVRTTMGQTPDANSIAMEFVSWGGFNLSMEKVANQ